jgi:ABC-type oligopeptide transport system substrate-binding subunit
MRWSDGTPLDAHSFAASIDRSQNPCVRTGRPSLTEVYLSAIKGATAFAAEACANGAPTGPITALIGTDASAGLVVPDAQTLVMHLAQPTSYFLLALTQTTSWAVPERLVQSFGAHWTAHLVVNGSLGGTSSS